MCKNLYFCSQASEDDPLSEIWDDGDLDAEDSTTADLPLPNIPDEYVQVKTVSGVHKIDLTTPEVRLQYSDLLIDYYYRKRMVRLLWTTFFSFTR